MEAINVYLQHLGMTNKRKKGKSKQKRNQDLLDVCNDTTLNTEKKKKRKKQGSTNQDGESMIDENMVFAMN